MADALLDAEDLRRLTGTKQAKRQCAWLEANGWVYLPPARRGDIPKVARAYHDARLSGRQADAAQPGQQQQPRRAGPRLDWMLEPTTA